MGYILPLNHQQYREYRKRDEQKEISPYTLEPVQHTPRYGRVQRNSAEDLYDFSRASVQKRDTSTKSYDHLVKQVDPEIVDNYFSDITGKGRNFNEYV